MHRWLQGGGGRREYGAERPNCSISQRLRLWLQDAADNFQGANFVLAASQTLETVSPQGLTGKAEVEDTCTSENLRVSKLLTMGIGGMSWEGPEGGETVLSGHGEAVAPVQLP